MADVSSSDVEEFFDAEEVSPEKLAWSQKLAQHQQSPKKDLKPASTEISIGQTDSCQKEVINSFGPLIIVDEEDPKEVEKRVLDNERRRRRMEEMRRRIQNDDDEVFDMTSLPSSQTSSLDGVYSAILAHKKPLVEDVQSMVSLGKVGRILSESETASLQESEGADGERSKECNLSSTKSLQEPDVVASAKAAERPCDLAPPVAPPRRKRKAKAPTKPTSLPQLPCQEACIGLPSPASAIESLAKEFEHSLDIRSAVQGQYVVKPQDEERAKAEGPMPSQMNVSQYPPHEEEPVKKDNGVNQLNMVVRTRTDSGKQLTDLEILEQVMVLNLDTGESVPLSLAEDRLPQCINPLSLHIMRLTSEYVSNSSLEKDKESDEDIDDGKSKTLQSTDSADPTGTKKKTRAQIKKLFNKTVERTVGKFKSVAEHTRHSEDIVIESSEEEPSGDPRHSVKFKSSSSHKGPYEFDNVRVVQDLSEHSATAGQDHILRIWVLRDAYDYFKDMRQKYNTEAKISPSPSQESLTSLHSGDGTEHTGPTNELESLDDGRAPFMSKPFCTYVGHTADLLDVSWSKNYFILSSSMDKTVRLWHISRKECLCCFQHIDFVTAIAFHPRDDRYFLSGSLDGKLRLWNIPDKKVALWNQLDGQTTLITAANFCQNGKFAVVGSYDGRCIFYSTEQLKYYTQIHVRSTRGKNSKGRKISGIEPMPGEDKILVTSNDSRIRLYDLRDLSLTCKYKGYTNLSSQIRASFSHDGKYIVSGSENQSVYLWKTHHDYAKFSSARRDRNDFWEGIKAHSAMVTAAVFAPKPSLIFQQEGKDKSCGDGIEHSNKGHGDHSLGYVLVTADFTGRIKVFFNRVKSKSGQ